MHVFGVSCGPLERMRSLTSLSKKDEVVPIMWRAINEVGE
jgi:hypothetical protein